MKFTTQKIIEAVKGVLEDNHSINASAKSIGMSKTNLSEYVQRVRKHGYDCLLKSNKYKKYDGGFKIQVVEYLIENHLSYYSAAAHFNLAKSVVQIWERIYWEEGSQTLFKERRGKDGE